MKATRSQQAGWMLLEWLKSLRTWGPGILWIIAASCCLFYMALNGWW